MSDIYRGPSESFAGIVDGYVDYGMNVIASRAIPDLRDGLKPVNRRIITSSNENDKGRLQKCVGVVGDALKLHPHGDSSVYGALCLLTDENGSLNVPFFHGMGNLGKAYSTKNPAQMRYPKVQINEAGKDFFYDSEAIDYIPAEEGEGVEPKVLPARYPVVLVNGSEGIAVAAGSKMPSFNLADVIDLTCTFIKKGQLDIDDMIVPDFPTGGILVRNDTELAKIMMTGKGRLKIRARVEIDKNEILIKEVPTGKSVEGIIKMINNADIKEIRSVSNSVGRNSKAMITIICKSKGVVENVLLTLYRMNILQNVFASNILVIEDGEPQIIGVFKLIEKWVNWRRSILNTKFTRLIDGIQEEKNRLDYFIRLCENEEWKDEYVRRITKEKKATCHEYLKSIFPDITVDVQDWIYDRKASSFNKGGTYKTRYETVLNTIKTWEYNLANIDEYIVNELQDIKKRKTAEGFCERHTEITYKDYKFSKITDSSEVKDTSYAVYTLKKDGFLVKSRDIIQGDDILCQFEGNASSILIGFDNCGRVLRVLGAEIPFSADLSQGTYLPKYFDSVSEGYKILYLCELDGSNKMLVYRDGFVGFFNTEEFLNKRNTKIISNGVCLAVMDKLLEVIEEKDIPEYILVADDTNALKIGIIPTRNIPVRSRTSRAKVLSGTDIDTKYLKLCSAFEVPTYITESENYVGKLKRFKGEFIGDPEEMLDGTYVDMCVDLEQNA